MVAGFRDFQTGEVLTAANVNDFLMQQSVMKFADAAARDTALGTAVGGGNALREGMVAYLDSTDEVIAYDGTTWSSVGLALGTAIPTDGQILAFGTATSTWNPIDPSGGFDSSVTITVTDSSWSVPASADGIFRVTVVGGGGGGGAWLVNGGATGGTTTFNAGTAGTLTAAGGAGGRQGATDASGRAGNAGFASENGGTGGIYSPTQDARNQAEHGAGGKVVTGYLDLTGISTVNVTIGAGGSGGAAGTQAGGNGGRGEVIVEYRSA